MKKPPPDIKVEKKDTLSNENVNGIASKIVKDLLKLLMKNLV